MPSFKLYSYYIFFILLLITLLPKAQASKAKFEQERKVLLQKIKSIKKILHQTEAKKKVSTGQLTAITKQIETNHLLIQSLNQEVEGINQELAQQVYQIARLEKELAQLKKEYASMTYLGAKTMHNIHILAFIFSSNSFQELFQKLSAIKQYAKIRQKHFKEIKSICTTLEKKQNLLKQQSVGKIFLLKKWREEQNTLTKLKQQQTQLITALEKQHAQLLTELTQRNTAVKALNQLITDLVKHEAKVRLQSQQAQVKTPNASKKNKLAPGMVALTTAFSQHRGKLTWPVKTGFISSKFGIQPHAVLKNIQIENLGIDIQTQEKSQAYAIFEGVVKTIAFVPGMNQVVIIQHGQYHTVYAKLQATSVKVGQHVSQKEPIGIIYTNKHGITELQLQIWKDATKLNPAGWLTKQPAE
jgi:septal ring factor EnvC (AmiA/AmiB activator)